MPTEKYGRLVVGHGNSMPFNREFIEKVGSMLFDCIPGFIHFFKRDLK